ncbi:MAG: c-type cytochrome [Vicinamibacteria bacterium]
MRKLLWAATVLVLAVGASVAVGRLRDENLGAVQRGYRIADETGCFTCHGPGGYRGMPDPGHGLEDVPPWSGGILSTYAESEGEIREWIVDGLPASVRKDPEQMKLRERAVVRMPAFRGILNDAQVTDLVAYVKAVGDFEKPKDERAEAGRQVALRLGCFNCHGPEGRGAMPNARAFKGYIPSWDGADFAELARDDQEIRDWLLDGGTKRLASSRAAQYFLERQPIKMPAYRGYVTDDEASRLVDYIHWVRQHPY